MQAKAKKPLFVQFVLDNIWAVYSAVVVQRLAFTFCVYTYSPFIECAMAGVLFTHMYMCMALSSDVLFRIGPSLLELVHLRLSRLELVH